MGSSKYIFVSALIGLMLLGLVPANDGFSQSLRRGARDLRRRAYQQSGSSQPTMPVARVAGATYRANEVIVKIRDNQPSLARSMKLNTLNTGSRNLNLLNAQFGVVNVQPVFSAQAGRVIQQEDALSNVMLLTLREDVDEHAALRAYASLTEVEYAELNYLYHIFGVPNDPFFSSQYGLYNTSSQGIDAINGWELEQGRDSVIIAIVDTGVDYNHEELSGRVIKGYDFVNNDTDPKDDNGHGTHVAGIAAARMNNGRGIAGVCPGCSILAVKVVTANGAGANTWIANGIANAVSLGANVINLSLGGLERSQTIELAIKQAYARGIVVIAASGNDGSSLPLYPAAFPEVIAVGATNQRGERASFSSYGTHLAVAAPGEAIPGSLPNNSYASWNGTSMASPHVAGLAGLILSRNAGLNNAQVRQILITTADDLGTAGQDQYFGYGRINALAALSQTPDNGGAYPDPVDPSPYPTPSPGGIATCGERVAGVFAMTLVGIGLVAVERRKRKTP